MNVFGFTVDLWTVWGLVAQGLFFLSFIVQWYKSEKAQESHLPVEFWYLRLIASVMLFSYVLVRRDLVFFVATILQSLIYMRNITLMKKNEK